MKKTKKVVSFLWVVMLVLNIFQGSNGYIEAVSNPQAEPPFVEHLRIDVEKRWREMPENGEEAFAEIALFRNDEEVNRVRMTGPSWYHTFDTDSTGADLPIRDADGAEYKYTVKEVACTAGYGVASETDIFDGPYEMPSPDYKKFTVYNSKLVNENLRILVKKYWIQGEMLATALPEGNINTDGAALVGEMQAGKPKPRPIDTTEPVSYEVSFKLYKNGEEINELTLANDSFQSVNNGEMEAEAFFDKDKSGNPLPFLEDGAVVNYQVEEVLKPHFQQLGKYKDKQGNKISFEFVNQLNPVEPRPKTIPKPIPKPDPNPQPKPKPKPEKPENRPEVGETTQIKVTKEWYLLPNPYGVIEDINKEVTFYLYKYTTEGAINELTITNDQFDMNGRASAVFTSDREGNPLPKMENGSEVDYIVLETPKYKPYVQERVIEEKVEEGRHFTFYNRNEKFTDDESLQKIYVIKNWIGKRGTAKFNLFQKKQNQEKVKIDTMTLYGDSKDYMWDNASLFERFDENDEPIEYFVEEEAIEGYESKMYDQGRAEATDIPSIYFKFENVEKKIPNEPEKPEPKKPEKPEPKEPEKPEPKEPEKPDKPEPQEPNNPKNPEPLTPYVPTPPTTPETEVPLEEPKVPEGEPSKPEVPVTPDKPNTPETPIPIEEPEPEPIPQGSPELPKTSGIPLEILAGAGLGLLVLGALLKKKKS